MTTPRTAADAVWAVDKGTGVISYQGASDGSTTVLQLHRFLQAWFDETMWSDPLIDITLDAGYPSERIDDRLIKLGPGLSIDPSSQRHLTGGAIQSVTPTCTSTIFFPER